MNIISGVCRAPTTAKQNTYIIIILNRVLDSCNNHGMWRHIRYVIVVVVVDNDNK